ncbi:hypothetical protein GWK47_002480 [Chionoecetes opilio]|uniref:Uncharacterized protein n=1 Tax=Chionoecetes opilio TaxID=41210 RepID=A0A8J5CGX1_CHIOP|nr:hypothetical protein GWK47_002480 [Chionoecetes opilio]
MAVCADATSVPQPECINFCPVGTFGNYECCDDHPGRCPYRPDCPENSDSRSGGPVAYPRLILDSPPQHNRLRGRCGGAGKQRPHSVYHRATVLPRAPSLPLVATSVSVTSPPRPLSQCPSPVGGTAWESTTVTLAFHSMVVLPWPGVLLLHCLCMLNMGGEPCDRTLCPCWVNGLECRTKWYILSVSVGDASYGKHGSRDDEGGMLRLLVGWSCGSVTKSH